MVALLLLLLLLLLLKLYRFQCYCYRICFCFVDCVANHSHKPHPYKHTRTHAHSPSFTYYIFKRVRMLACTDVCVCVCDYSLLVTTFPMLPGSQNSTASHMNFKRNICRRIQDSKTATDALVKDFYWFYRFCRVSYLISSSFVPTRKNTINIFVVFFSKQQAAAALIV